MAMDEETEERLSELSERITSNTVALEALLSGLFDKSVEYNDGVNEYAFETKKGALIDSIYHFTIKAKICNLKGGVFDSKTGKCKYKK